MKPLIKPKAIKEKLCINKACKKPFKQYNSMQSVCSVACSIVIAKKKAQEKEEREWKVRKKAGLDNLKTPSEFKSDLEEVINAIVRLIDKGHECISSGAKVYQVNAGHLYSVGAFPELRFNLLNIFNQSVHDNFSKSGNGVIYKERIKEIFGIEVSEEIENLKILYPSLQMSIPEIKEAIKKAREVKRGLEKITKDQEMPFEIHQRIILRRELNSIIGIYKAKDINRKREGYFDPEELRDII